MGKVLIWGKSAYFRKWRISNLRYSLYRIDSSIRIGLFVYNFPKKFSNLKNVSENEDQKLFKNLKFSLKQLNVEKYTGYLFFRNPPLHQMSTF